MRSWEVRTSRCAGLGLGATGNNIELNLIVDSNRDRQELKQWFSEIWNDDTLVKDVKADVLNYLQQTVRESVAAVHLLPDAVPSVS